MDARLLVTRWGGASKFSRMTGFKLSTCQKASSGQRETFIDKCATMIDCWLEQGNRDKEYDKKEEL
ncbi:MAG: hypothetical protein ACTSQB_05785 [Candidatus Heimdallarchaeota archaeon]